jgi:hypothetical protein
MPLFFFTTIVISDISFTTIVISDILFTTIVMFGIFFTTLVMSGMCTLVVLPINIFWRRRLMDQHSHP